MTSGRTRIITTAAPTSVGFGQRACRVKGRGYAVQISAAVMYGPAGALGRQVEMVLTTEQAMRLAEQLKTQAMACLDHVSQTNSKMLEAV